VDVLFTFCLLPAAAALLRDRLITSPLAMSSPVTYLDPLVSQDYEHLFKCLLLGNSGCGKSSIVDRFVDPQHVLRTNYITTIGVDFKVQSFLWDGRVVKLQVTPQFPPPPPPRLISLSSLRFGTRLDKKDFAQLSILIIVVHMESYSSMISLTHPPPSH
jgi:hypothetical protein